jgi:2',3'-cyclic-nucleotide 2'-phosphodiesterase (5'-nucleotidase family)
MRPNRAVAPLASCALAAVLVAGCEIATPPPRDAATASTSAPRPSASSQVNLTLLYTSDEHGWLLPFTEDGVTWGGAASVLGMWITREGHCPGPAPPDFTADVLPSICADPKTIAISGGDSYTGPAVSTFFAGSSTARLMRRMGYSVAAFGNHDFDFGRAQFLKNRDTAGIAYLGSNMKVVDTSIDGMQLPKFVTINRRGAKIAIVGMATDTTPTTAMPSRFVGISFLPEEPALDDAIREAWATHPDAVVAIAHECPDKLAPMLERHPEWRLAFFGGAHCHKVMARVIGGVSLMSPGWRFQHYVRVPMVIDPRLPEKERVLSARAEIVETAGAPGDPAIPPDHALQAMLTNDKAKMEAALGEEIGYTRTGLAKDSREIAQWIANAWREELKADVAVINTGGIRQGIPKGPITKAVLWGVMPFDNHIVVVKLKGKDLIADLGMDEMAAAGITATRGGFVLADGRTVDPERVYGVVTIDFLYLGGAHAPFATQDPSATDTDVDWRAPVIAWTKRVTTAGFPIEAKLPRGGVYNP